LAGKNAKECAKLGGLMLIHFGQLRAYSNGARPELIEMNKPGLSVDFNAWFAQLHASDQFIKGAGFDGGFNTRLCHFSHYCRERT